MVHLHHIHHIHKSVSTVAVAIAALNQTFEQLVDTDFCESSAYNDCPQLVWRKHHVQPFTNSGDQRDRTQTVSSSCLPCKLGTTPMLSKQSAETAAPGLCTPTTLRLQRPDAGRMGEYAPYVPAPYR